MAGRCIKKGGIIVSEKGIKEAIRQGKTALGIELGSTRIKAVLVDGNHKPIASGSYTWENRYENNIWTYDLADIWAGIQGSFEKMALDVKENYGEIITTVGAIGISAMMHGYLALDGSGELLVPFRTWRNTRTGKASEKLSELFSFPIPQRWSIAHLYQAVLNGEEHVGRIHFLTTLAGYVHYMLTGERVLGIGDASGMFPVDSAALDYQENMVRQFEELIKDKEIPWRLKDILPKIRMAGEPGGILNEAGAALLDPSGKLKPGILLCPPEGDAGTGMAATKSVEKRTGNVSAGTSVFAMVVLEKELSKVYPEIDLVATPSGDPVAMVHCNNCTSDLNAWVSLFGEFASACGMSLSRDELYSTLLGQALEGDKDCGGLLSYNYLSGEHVTGFSEGRPLFIRRPDSVFDLKNFMRVHLYTALGALKMGMDILLKEEKVKLSGLTGHGGFFKTTEAGQRILAAAMGATISVMETAGEGGAWGAALLASYLIWKKEGQTLSQYLSQQVFKGQSGRVMYPEPEDEQGFEQFMEQYRAGLMVERAAVECLEEQKQDCGENPAGTEEGQGTVHG